MFAAGKAANRPPRSAMEDQNRLTPSRSIQERAKTGFASGFCGAAI
jgi:hypothetical protein